MQGTTFDVDVIAAGRGRTTSYADGAVIYRRGERGDCAYIVARGRVRIGDGMPLELLLPGEIFGELSLLDDGRRAASAQAVGQTEVIAIDRPLFNALLRDDPDFAETLMRLMVRRLRATLAMLDRAAEKEGAGLRAMA